jgi:NAD(P)-dependent dehydrogenase (short-subunit alcohol dehydrogenase family)
MIGEVEFGNDSPGGRRVAGKKVLITGAAQGLGAACARLLARHGARVTLADLNLAGAQSVAGQINAEQGAGTAFAVRLDVRNEPEWIEVLERANAHMEGMSVLVNNAGIIGSGSIEELSFADWRRTHEVNLDGVFLGAKYALPYLRKNQPGSIINLSSIAGLIASHSMPAYNSSKAAVWMLSKSIALHCAREKLDIRCNSVHPTFINTPILDELRRQYGTAAAEEKLARQVPLGRIGEPADVAFAVLYLASDESRFVTGAELKVDGGISAL